MRRRDVTEEEVLAAKGDNLANLYIDDTAKTKEDVVTAATKIQSAFRGMITRKLAAEKLAARKSKEELDELSEGASGAPSPTGSAYDDVLNQIYLNPNYEGTLEPENGIMDRHTLQQELNTVSDTPVNAKSNRLLHFNGQIRNNGLTNGYSHDCHYMDKYGNITTKYDLDRAFARLNFSSSILTASTRGSGDIGSYRFIEFEGSKNIDPSYKTGSETADVPYVTREPEMIYVNGKGDVIHYIGAQYLKNQIDEEVTKYNQLDEDEQKGLDYYLRDESITEKLLKTKQQTQGWINGIIENPKFALEDEDDKKTLSIIAQNLGLDIENDDDLDDLQNSYAGSSKEVKDKISLEIQKILLKESVLDEKPSIAEEDLEKTVNYALAIHSIMDPEKIRDKQLDNLKQRILNNQVAPEDQKALKEFLPIAAKLLGIEKTEGEELDPRTVIATYNRATPETKEKVDLELKLRSNALDITPEELKSKEPEERYELLRNATVKPFSSEEIDELIKNNPQLKENLELETKLASREEFQQHASKLEGKTSEQRYETLKAISRNENRAHSEEFVRGRFEAQEASLADQKDTLKLFRDKILEKSSGSKLSSHEIFKGLAQDTPTFPISDHGVAISMRYTGAAVKGASSRRTKIASVCFNSTDDRPVDEEENEKFIQIPNTNFYKRIVRVPAANNEKLPGSIPFVYKDGKRTELEPSTEERIEHDKNTIWEFKRTPIPGSDPVKFTTKPTPYRLLSWTGGITDDLKRRVVPSIIDSIAEGYKNLGIEAMSINNGVVKALSTQVAGTNITISLKQSDVAKNSIESDQDKIINSYNALLDIPDTAPKEDIDSAEKSLSQAIISHEDNLNRLSKSGQGTTENVNKLLSSFGGTGIKTVTELGIRTTPKETILFDIKRTLRNESLRTLDDYVDNPNQKPSVQQFRRQLARYAVLMANHEYTQSSRENIFAEIFEFANDSLTQYAPLDLDRKKFNEDLLQEIKGYAHGKGENSWMPSLLKGYNAIERARAESGMNKTLTPEIKKSMEIAQQVVASNSSSLPSLPSELLRLDENAQYNFDNSIDYSPVNSVAMAFNGKSLPEVPNGFTTSKENAIKHLGTIFDTIFSKSVNYYLGESQFRPDVNEFSRRVAKYAVEGAQHDLLASTREQFLEGVIKLANDELTKHGILTNREQFTENLTRNIEQYAQNRSKETGYGPTMKQSGYKTIAEKRAINAETRFKEYTGYQLGLSIEENKCLKILINTDEINPNTGENYSTQERIDIITNLPVTSIAKVRQGYDMAQNYGTTEIKPKPLKSSNFITPFGDLMDQVFPDRNFSNHPIDLENPVDVLKICQYKYEAAKLITEYGKKFSRQEDGRRGFEKNYLGHDVEGRQAPMNDAIGNANTPLINLGINQEVGKSMTELVSQHAMDKKGESLSYSPTHARSKYSNMAKAMNPDPSNPATTTQQKWTDRVEAASSAPSTGRGGGGVTAA